jgi:two-component system copper resistance phosphate regulon response regulator CusR
MKILLVEDDARVRSVLSRGLGEEGFELREVETGDAALALLQTEPADLVLLDWLLPGTLGIDVLKRLRARGDVTPVVMLTALDEVADRVAALDAGADDYVTKPFAFEELLARVRAVLRRAEPRKGPQLRCADLTLDPLTRRVARGEVAIKLTAREFSLLQFLMEHQDESLSRRRIVEAVWEHVSESHTNLVDVYVRYLRLKVDEAFPTKLIQTVRGVGYVLRAPRPVAP